MVRAGENLPILTIFNFDPVKIGLIHFVRLNILLSSWHAESME